MHKKYKCPNVGKLLPGSFFFFFLAVGEWMNKYTNDYHRQT